jgi:sugar phosphate isomerase/epimerase
MSNASAFVSVGLLPSLENSAEIKAHNFEPADGFSLKIFATSWGYEGSIDSFCALAKNLGYEGIEVWWTSVKKEQDELFTALKKHQLSVGFLAGSGESDATKNLEQFKKMVIEATEQIILKPTYINCHSGKDFFSYEQNKAFIDFTTDISKKSGIPIYHETHRGRMLFAANIAKNFMEKNPELRLTLDISHWCNVHESLLGDQPEAVAMALARTGHIHTRVGYEEGPQVTDPRAPEWENTVKTHLSWWDKVVEMKKKSGQPITMLTEFGPPNYLHTLPYTQQPVANQWEINVYMMKMLRKRYL